MQLFFVESISEKGGLLTQTDSRHAVKVLRKKAGDTIHVTPGNGNLYTCRINEAHPKKCTFEVIEQKETPQNRNYRLHIAAAPTKSIDRFEWFLEKAVEIGIDEITPVFCSRSERKKIKPDRCMRVIQAAAKQSLNLHLPQFNSPVSLKEFLEGEASGSDRKIIAWCEESRPRTPLKEAVQFSRSEPNNITALVGPEGDFTDEEARLAEQKGFTPVTLGDSRLRSETAAVYICNAVHILQPLTS